MKLAKGYKPWSHLTTKEKLKFAQTYGCSGFQQASENYDRLKIAELSVKPVKTKKLKQ